MASSLTSRLPQMDAYIARAQPFAQPILLHLRDTMHRVVPGVEEAMKWSMPFFLYQGVILANMAGHKAHASFGLWGWEPADSLPGNGASAKGGMGSLGRLTALHDLPPQPELERYITHAAERIRSGAHTKSIQRVTRPARPDAEVPRALAEALEGHPTAAQQFAVLSPSCRREYIEWIAEAKREETRTRRVQEAIGWIAEGKSRYWRYSRPA